MLVAVPRLLHLHSLQPVNSVHEVCPAHVPRVLLAGDGQRYGQPHNILLDECQVSKSLVYYNSKVIQNEVFSFTFELRFS
jgi:hypothetical protein